MTGSTVTDEGGRIAALVIRGHEPRPFGCSCGAQIGDDIDRRWHLINQAIAAALEAAARTAQPAPAQPIECDCYKLAPTWIDFGEHHRRCPNHPKAQEGGRFRLAWISAQARARRYRATLELSPQPQLTATREKLTEAQETARELLAADCDDERAHQLARFVLASGVVQEAPAQLTTCEFDRRYSVSGGSGDPGPCGTCDDCTTEPQSVPVPDLAAALRTSVEAAKARRLGSTTEQSVPVVDVEKLGEDLKRAISDWSFRPDIRAVVAELLAAGVFQSEADVRADELTGLVDYLLNDEAARPLKTWNQVVTAIQHRTAAIRAGGQA